MQMIRLLWLLAFSCLFSAAGAQSAPNSLDPGSKTAFHAPRSEKKVKHRRVNVKHTARYEFYERVEKAAREKKRILKKLASPQFSDFRYFGHKRIPKRRVSYKMRYCDECGIRH